MRRSYQTRKLERHSRKPAELLLVPMIDIFTVLVTFLLMTAVFSRTVILQLNLPASQTEFREPPPGLQLEVMVRKELIQVADRNTGPLATLPNTPGGYGPTPRPGPPGSGAPGRSGTGRRYPPARRGGVWQRSTPMSMSHRAQRMAQHHLRHRADAQLNLIPLIDILSVMVAFLLVYSIEVEVIQNAKGIEIPQSIAEVAPKASVVVMITRTDLFVQGEFIATVAEIRAGQGRLVERLRAALKRPLLVGREMSARDTAQREITSLAAKALPHEVLKRVMATCTDADYGRI